MKLFQFGYSDGDSLREELDKLQQYYQGEGTANMLFHVFTDTPDKEKTDVVCAIIEEKNAPCAIHRLFHQRQHSLRRPGQKQYFRHLRRDNALYNAKHKGKNCLIVD